HPGVNVYRFLISFGVSGPGDIPVSAFLSFSAWYNFAYVAVSSVMIWIADFLVIYRCYIIWGCQYEIIAIPSLLLIISIATNGINWYFFLHPSQLPFVAVKPLLDLVYPGHLAQNIITTGLIAWKLWMQHMRSRRIGLRVSSSITLMTVARIIVESAMIYTLQMVSLVILYFLKHPALILPQEAIVPSTGIIFVLMSIRVHLARQEASKLSQTTSVFLPSWIGRIEDEERKPGADWLQDEFDWRVSRASSVALPIDGA
ncbi:hypothetical protein FA15DRAFT_600618, partial [Coprinopsis marcescibilis]